jgi:hypothetical protein
LRVKELGRNYPQENCSEAGTPATGLISLRLGPKVRRGRFWGCRMRGNSSRAEHYRKLAVKYHELGKSARPSYLGDFYRGVAVRYVFMAQEASDRSKRKTEVSTHQAEPASSNNDSDGIFNFLVSGPEGDYEDRTSQPTSKLETDQSRDVFESGSEPCG